MSVRCKCTKLTCLLQRVLSCELKDLNVHTTVSMVVYAKTFVPMNVIKFVFLERE